MTTDKSVIDSSLRDELRKYITFKGDRAVLDMEINEEWVMIPLSKLEMIIHDYLPPVPKDLEDYEYD